MLNTNVYEVMFPDGSTSRYATNIIAENIYSQVDADGHRFQFMDHIMDHKSNWLRKRMRLRYLATVTK